MLEGKRKSGKKEVEEEKEIAVMLKVSLEEALLV